MTRAAFEKEMCLDGVSKGVFYFCWSKKAHDFLIDNQFENVLFDGEFGRFEFLSSFSDIIEEGSFFNEGGYVDGIIKLKNLKRLFLPGKIKGKCDLNKLEMLEYVSLIWKKAGFPNLFEHKNIKKLRVDYCGEDKFGGVEENLSLKSLSMDRLKMQSLSGISRFSNLSYLSIKDAKKLESICGLGALNNLKLLEIDYAPSVVDVNEIGLLKDLEWLSLSRVAKFTDLSFVYKLKNIRRLVVLGNSVKVVWKKLMLLPQLEVVMLHVDNKSEIAEEELLSLIASTNLKVKDIRVDNGFYSIKFKALGESVDRRRYDV